MIEDPRNDGVRSPERWDGGGHRHLSGPAAPVSRCVGCRRDDLSVDLALHPIDAALELLSAAVVGGGAPHLETRVGDDVPGGRMDDGHLGRRLVLCRERQSLGGLVSLEVAALDRDGIVGARRRHVGGERYPSFPGGKLGRQWGCGDRVPVDAALDGGNARGIGVCRHAGNDIFCGAFYRHASIGDLRRVRGSGDGKGRWLDIYRFERLVGQWHDAVSKSIRSLADFRVHVSGLAGDLRTAWSSDSVPGRPRWSRASRLPGAWPGS